MLRGKKKFKDYFKLPSFGGILRIFSRLPSGTRKKKRDRMSFQLNLVQNYRGKKQTHAIARKRHLKWKRIGWLLPVVLVCITGGTGWIYVGELQRPLYISPLVGVLSVTTSGVPRQENNKYLLEAQLRVKQIPFVSIEPTEGGYTVAREDGSEILFSSQKDINSQISSLQLILSRLTMESKLFSRLDLRFDKPIIVLQ